MLRFCAAGCATPGPRPFLWPEPVARAPYGLDMARRQSAVASAAYQSGERLFSEYDQKQKYYWLTRPLSQKVQTPYPDEVEAFLRRTSYCMNEPFETGGDTLYVSKASSGIEGVYLVHVFAKSTVESQNTPIYSALGAIWGCGVLAFSVITLLIAAFLTKPFETLRQIVDEINRGVYDRPRQFKYRDEAGLLGAQINQMYATIQEQIRQIKREEAEKAQADSEQINPHFLYNTLERIHFQILNEHTEAASRMVESLGQYLRITLSHGQLLIPLEKEIAHVTQYMNIINSHAQEDKIRFACHCDSALLSRPVLKLILQPLVENAVKRGFSQDLRSYILPPEITVTVTAGDDYLQYEIADNGKGIDIPHAEACMRRSYQENGSHFGLQNIYRRLRSTYGDGVSIRFSSIPYLRSVVTVRIPQKPKAMQ